MRRPRFGALAALAALAMPTFGFAATLGTADVAKLCANAEDSMHCGRLVEARQLPAASRFAERNGDLLRIGLLPFGLTVFRDSVDISGARSYAFWDYLDALETVVLFATEGERSGFMLLQRRGGREVRIPSEPIVSPDSQQFATADFCDAGCDNEIAVWRISADGIRKSLRWTPPSRWSDASVTWRGNDALKIEYSTAEQPGSRIVERRLNDASWDKVR